MPEILTEQSHVRVIAWKKCSLEGESKESCWIQSRHRDCTGDGNVELVHESEKAVWNEQAGAH
jgi:thymidylate synthase